MKMSCRCNEIKAIVIEKQLISFVLFYDCFGTVVVSQGDVSKEISAVKMTIDRCVMLTCLAPESTHYSTSFLIYK